MRVLIEFDWAEVGAIRRSALGRLDIPQVAAEPGIYRFRVATTTGADVYIGESQDLRHRKVRNDASAHTGRTTVQTRETLLRRLAEGRDIRLAIVIKAALGIDGEWVTADLGVKDTRRLIESAALALARRAGDQIQNLEPRSTEAAGTDEEARLRKIRADNQAAC